jgi:hypothetical protein
MIEVAEKVLAWWCLGVIQAADVKRWADEAIGRIDDPADMPGWLLTLSLDGPDVDLRPDGPKQRQLDYIEGFRAMVEVTDIDDQAAVERFANWVARNWSAVNGGSGEDDVGYAIQEAFELAFCPPPTPLEIAREALRTYKPTCTDIADHLPWLARSADKADC